MVKTQDLVAANPSNFPPKAIQESEVYDKNGGCVLLVMDEFDVCAIHLWALRSSASQECIDLCKSTINGSTLLGVHVTPKYHQWMHLAVRRAGSLNYVILFAVNIKMRTQSPIGCFVL